MTRALTTLRLEHHSVGPSAGLRWGQVNTYLRLRLTVTLNNLGYNVKFNDLSP